MPYYENENLYTFIRKFVNFINFPELFKTVFRNILDALIYLDNNLFVSHRDIKPQNILVES